MEEGIELAQLHERNTSVLNVWHRELLSLNANIAGL